VVCLWLCGTAVLLCGCVAQLAVERVRARSSQPRAAAACGASWHAHATLLHGLQRSYYTWVMAVGRWLGRIPAQVR
jgi:hypothetical protein